MLLLRLTTPLPPSFLRLVTGIMSSSTDDLNASLN
jgi:hypothetical protein